MPLLAAALFLSIALAAACKVEPAPRGATVLLASVLQASDPECCVRVGVGSMLADCSRGSVYIFASEDCSVRTLLAVAPIDAPLQYLLGAVDGDNIHVRALQVSCAHNASAPTSFGVLEDRANVNVDGAERPAVLLHPHLRPPRPSIVLDETIRPSSSEEFDVNSSTSSHLAHAATAPGPMSRHRRNSALTIYVSAASTAPAPLCGATLATACPTMAAAFAAAAAAVVAVPPPRVLEMVIAAGLYGCVSGGGMLSVDEVIIRGAGTQATVVSCSPTEVSAFAFSAAVGNITGITFANAVHSPALGWSASMTSVSAAPALYVSNCNFINNSFGIVAEFAVIASSLVVSMDNCHFVNNFNGAVSVGVGPFAGNNAVVAVSQCTVVGNVATGTGAFSISFFGSVYGAQLRFSGAHFLGNMNTNPLANQMTNMSSFRGGGLSVVFMNPATNCSIVVEHSNFTNNANSNAASNCGGGLSVFYSANAVECSFESLDNSFTNNYNYINSDTNLFPTSTYSNLGGAISVYYSDIAYNCSVVSRSSAYIGNNNNINSDTYLASAYNYGGALSVYYAEPAFNCSFASMSDFYLTNTNGITNAEASGNVGASVSVYYAVGALQSTVTVHSSVFSLSNNTASSANANTNYGAGLSVLFEGAASECAYSGWNNTFTNNFNNNNNEGNNYDNYGGALSLFYQGSSVSCAHAEHASMYTTNSNNNTMMGSVDCMGSNSGAAFSVYFVSSAVNCSTAVAGTTFVGNTNILAYGCDCSNYGGALSVYYAQSATNCTFGILSNVFMSNVNSMYSSSTVNFGGAVSLYYSGNALSCQTNSSANVFTNNSNSLTSTSGFLLINYGGAMSVFYTANAAFCGFWGSSNSFTGNSNSNSNNFNSDQFDSVTNFGGGLGITYSGPATECTAADSHSSYIRNFNSCALDNSASNCGAGICVSYVGVGTQCSWQSSYNYFQGNSNLNAHNMGNCQNYGAGLAVEYQGNAVDAILLDHHNVFFENLNMVSNTNGMDLGQSNNGAQNYGGGMSYLFGGSVSNATISSSNSSFDSNGNVHNGNYQNLNGNYGGAFAITFNGIAANVTMTHSLNAYTGNLNTNANAVSGGIANTGAGLSVNFATSSENCIFYDNFSSFWNNGNLNQDGFTNSSLIFSPSNYGALAIIFTGPAVNNQITTNASSFMHNSNKNKFNVGALNFGGALAVIFFTNASLCTIHSSGGKYFNNSNLNSDCYSINSNRGGAVNLVFGGSANNCSFLSTGDSFQLNTNVLIGTSDISAVGAKSNSGGAIAVIFQGNSFFSSVGVDGANFVANSNAITNTVNFNYNYGGAFAVEGQSVSMDCTVAISNSQFHSNSNNQFENDNLNYNYGGAVSIRCFGCARFAVRATSLAFVSNQNNILGNHLINLNAGGAMDVTFGWPLLGCTAELRNITASLNGNTLLGSGEDLGNFGGAVFFNTTGGSVGLTVVESVFTSNVNNISLTLNGGNYGAAICLSPGLPLACNTTSTSTTGLTLDEVQFVYQDGFPADALVYMAPRSVGTAQVCGPPIADCGLRSADNQCNLVCAAGKVLEGFACVYAAPDHSQLSVGECAAIGIGIGLGMLVTVVLLFVWSRWLLNRSHRKHEYERMGLTERLLSTELEVSTLRKAWEISWAELELKEEIGRGAFGTVYRATWRDMSVAVKTVAGSFSSLGGHDSNPLSGELDKEISMLQLVRHPNIVLFFGAGTTPESLPFLATELMENGTLTSYLANNAHLPWRQKTTFALDTARGMAHVHSLGRMHRDLKSGNLLISSSLRVKVADFGTATIAGMAGEGPHDDRVAPLGRTRSVVSASPNSLASTQRTKGVGTPLWMAPELLMGKSVYGPSADVYSFGIVLWEIAAQRTPWDDVNCKSFFMDALLQEILAERRPPVEAEWPAVYRTVMAQSWATDPAARITFVQAVSELEQML